MYCLFDANVIAAYYLPESTRSKKLAKNMRIIVESVRCGESKHFFYIPNFCIAEVFGVFMKYAYGKWNRQVKKPIDARVHQRCRRQFQEDIHNASLFYHYELSRYHVLAVDLVAPIDHYYQITRTRKKPKRHAPAGTFDQLIVAMGVHLAKIHGPDNVCVITGDNRLVGLMEKCRGKIPATVQERLGLDKTVYHLTGIPFGPQSFPNVLHPRASSKGRFSDVFGQWPLPIKRRYSGPRWLRPSVLP